MRRFMLLLAMAFSLAVPLTVLADTAVETPASVSAVAGDESTPAVETPVKAVTAVVSSDESTAAVETADDQLTPVDETSKIPDLEEDLGKFLTVMLEAFKAGNWALGFTMLGMLLLWALRKYGPRLIPALATEGASVIVTLLLSAVASLATAAYNGDTLTLGLAWKAISIGLTAIGGFAALQHLAAPLWEKLKAKLFGSKKEAAPTPEA